jgi:hypothetical protein
MIKLDWIKKLYETSTLDSELKVIKKRYSTVVEKQTNIELLILANKLIKTQETKKKAIDKVCNEHLGNFTSLTTNQLS